MGELFLDKPDELVLVFDKIMQAVMQWQPNHAGTCKHTVVLTNKRAWLIIKPMKLALDVKFYCKEEIDAELIKTRTKYPNKYAHHIRVCREEDVTSEFLHLLRVGYDYANGK